MVEYSLDKLLGLPHLSQFSLSEVFTKLGIYQDVVIDCFDLERKVIRDEVQYEQIIAGKDVRMLELLRFSTNTFMMPCKYCQESQPFKMMRHPSSLNASNKCIVLSSENDYDTEILCQFIQDPFDTIETIEEKYINPTKHKCKDNVLSFSEKFSREYTCQLELSHKVYGEFIIEEIKIKENPPKEVIEYEEQFRIAEVNGTEEPEMDEIVKLYYHNMNKVKGYVLIKKVGQYPSMADMQFYECKKYNKILKHNYKDYTMALGLYASGVGCGSFLYLRRILESMVEELHTECKQISDWDEKKYEKLHFNEKIDMIEKTGRSIFPTELESVRTRLYGILSKGIHESSESECKEVFPYVKFAIDIMLDAKLAEKDKNDKLKQLTKLINNHTY